MAAPDHDTPADLAGPPGGATDDPPRGPRWGVWGALALMVAMAALWAYAFLVPQDVPGEMEDSTFPTTAEPRCAATIEALGALPRSIEVTSSAERAELVDAATSELERMVDDLDTMVPTAEPERQMVTEWLDDWRAYLANRRDYADRLRTDADARFYVDQSDRDGVQITNALDRFANVNRMSSCTVPDDVG